MDDSRDELLSQLAEDVEESLSGLQWLKKGAKDERDVKKVMRSRKTLDKAIDAYAKFSDEIEGLDFDDEHNNKWFDKWRSLKADISEIQARMEATVSVVAHSGEDDAFASDDENDKPNAEGIAASLQMADDIKATMDKDIERLADILRISEELKDLADHCLEELQHQRERLMAINAKLKAIDKKVERAEGILERIKVNMAANKCCWAIGCSVIWLLVIIVVVGALCGTGNCGAPAAAPGATTSAPSPGGRFLRG
eukprot:INCI14690.1.p2 GENE.INCI14690.1~~INCI14690.1.p2  ORF type:complete len:254 (+),score=67.95 INCI14690.1:294-1055(+)